MHSAIQSFVRHLIEKKLENRIKSKRDKKREKEEKEKEKKKKKEKKKPDGFKPLDECGMAEVFFQYMHILTNNTNRVLTCLQFENISVMIFSILCLNGLVIACLIKNLL